MRLVVARAFVVALVCAALPVSASAWGRNGHRAIALAAYELLTPTARQRVAAILGRESIADAAIWPDEIRHRDGGHRVGDARPDTAAWHFVNIPLAADRFDARASYCRDRECIVTAIDRARDVLRNPDSSRRELRDALAFLVHLVGDVHQPLHCADNGDAGGNDVLVTWEGEPARPGGAAWSLHAFWDDEVVDRSISRLPARQRRASGLARSLVASLGDAEMDDTRNDGMGQGSVVAWAEASHALARAVAYDLPSRRAERAMDGTVRRDARGRVVGLVVLDRAYVERATSAAFAQMRRASGRLARLLNELFDEGARRG